jgi:hypothetical protein
MNKLDILEKLKSVQPNDYSELDYTVKELIKNLESDPEISSQGAWQNG